MSIASEITRLQTAKADIKAAIEGKGVTVPSAATLDDYADYVDGIQTASPVTVTDATDTAGGIIRTITAQGAVIPSASGAFSKIILNGITQIDLTQDTVAAANLLTGETAHGADGQPVVGAASGGGGVQTGTFTIASDIKTVTISLDDADIKFIVATVPNPTQADPDAGGWKTTTILYFPSENLSRSFTVYTSGSYFSTANLSAIVDGNDITFNTNYKMKAGDTFTWYAW